MGVRNIKKQLAGVEDLLLGVGTQVQERNSGSVPITKIDLVGLVNTVEDLATLDVTKYTTAIVKDLDRGGTFEWSATGTANGGTVFAGVSGYWNRQYSGAVNVKWFGAKGDGTTDDTVAIQLAINSSRNIVFTRGIFLVTASIVSTHSEQVICGEDSTIVTDNQIPIFSINGVSSPYKFNKNTKISGIKFILNNTSSVGIKTKFTHNLIIEKCIFEGQSLGFLTANGIEHCTEAGTGCVKGITQNNSFYKLGVGILGGDTSINSFVSDYWVLNNLFEDCSEYAMCMGYCDGITAVSNKVFNSYVAVYPNVGFRIDKSPWLTITDNSFFELGSSGLLLKSPNYTTINNNKFVNCNKSISSALIISDYDGTKASNDIRIIDNEFVTNNRTAIQVSSSIQGHFNFQIKNNYFKGNGTSANATYDAISIAGLSDSNISENIIEGDSITRYWLNTDNVQNITVFDNTYKLCTQLDIGRINSPTLKFLKSNKITSITSEYTMVFNEDGVLCDATSGAFKVNLVSATSCPTKQITIIKTDASGNAITIDPASTQTINGASTYQVSAQYGSVTLMSNGTNWIVIN